MKNSIVKSQSVVDTSNQSELLKVISKYVDDKVVMQSNAMDLIIKKAEELYHPEMSESELDTFNKLIADCERIQHNYDSMLLNEIKKSKGKVDNYGIPTSFSMDKEVLFGEAFKHQILDLVKTITKDSGENLTENQFIELHETLIREVVPLTFDVIRIKMGKAFQERINTIKELMSDSELPTNEFYFETMEKASVHFANLHKYGHYKSKRDAWKDAVNRGVTYSSNQIKVKNFKQLEKALERVREWGKEEELGLLK